jgi:hypothetical protein
MDLKSLPQSKALVYILIVIGAVIILLLVFKGGEVVGFRKAGFSYRWGENYYRNFAGPRPMLPMDRGGRDFLMSHGTSGSIIKITDSTLVVQGRDNAEKAILLGKDTIIKRLRDTISASDLKVGDYVVIIGSPNDAGQIEAKLVRVMPSPPPPGAL